MYLLLCVGFYDLPRAAPTVQQGCFLHAVRLIRLLIPGDSAYGVNSSSAFHPLRLSIYVVRALSEGRSRRDAAPRRLLRGVLFCLVATVSWGCMFPVMTSALTQMVRAEIISSCQPETWMRISRMPQVPSQTRRIPSSLSPWIDSRSSANARGVAHASPPAWWSRPS